MDDSIYSERYDYAQKRMNDLFEWLKKKFNCKISYTLSYANYCKLSDYGSATIEFDGVKAISNSITLNTYMVDCRTEYFLSFWYYTGGNEGHHSYKFDISKDLVSDDDFFFNYVKDYIEDIFKLKDKTASKRQLTIFDFINGGNDYDLSRI